MIQPIRQNPYASPQTPTATDKPAQVVVTNVDISFSSILFIGIKIVAVMHILGIIGAIVWCILAIAATPIVAMFSR